MEKVKAKTLADIEAFEKVPLEERLTFLNTYAMITQGAAIPKEIYIFDQLPLTPVGKIFKPALRWDAVKRVYQAELKALGDKAHSIEVTVTEDKVHGTLATITIQAAAGVSGKEIEDTVQEILARYTVQYRLAIA